MGQEPFSRSLDFETSRCDVPLLPEPESAVLVQSGFPCSLNSEAEFWAGLFGATPPAAISALAVAAFAGHVRVGRAPPDRAAQPGMEGPARRKRSTLSGGLVQQLERRNAAPSPTGSARLGASRAEGGGVARAGGRACARAGGRAARLRAAHALARARAWATAHCRAGGDRRLQPGVVQKSGQIRPHRPSDVDGHPCNLRFCARAGGQAARRRSAHALARAGAPAGGRTRIAALAARAGASPGVVHQFAPADPRMWTIILANGASSHATHPELARFAQVLGLWSRFRPVFGETPLRTLGLFYPTSLVDSTRAP